MKKMVLQLDNYDVQVWIEFIKNSIENTRFLGYTKQFTDMMILAAVAEIFEQLVAVYSPYKAKYKIKITKSSGIAFLAHCTGKGKMLPGNFDNITLNGIIAQIDNQKN